MEANESAPWLPVVTATAAALVVLTLAALCVVVVGTTRSARHRTLVRERWHVGDDGPG